MVGLPLLDWLFAREETSESLVAEVLIQLIDVLQFLHERNIAHLDIKVSKRMHIIRCKTFN